MLKCFLFPFVSFFPSYGIDNTVETQQSRNSKFHYHI